MVLGAGLELAVQLSDRADWRQLEDGWRSAVSPGGTEKAAPSSDNDFDFECSVSLAASCDAWLEYPEGTVI